MKQKELWLFCEFVARDSQYKGRTCNVKRFKICFGLMIEDLWKSLLAVVVMTVTAKSACYIIFNKIGRIFIP